MLCKLTEISEILKSGYNKRSKSDTQEERQSPCDDKLVKGAIFPLKGWLEIQKYLQEAEDDKYYMRQVIILSRKINYNTN